MKTRYRSFAITITVLTLVTGSVSCNAANWFPFYAIGGLGKAETFPFVFGGSTSDGRPTVTASEDNDTIYRLGAGYSFNETWSVEASYVVGPTKERSLSSEISFGDQVFTQTADIKIDVTLFRACAVYERSFVDPISFVGKLGFVHVTSESKFSSGGFIGAPGFSISDTNDETKAFASTGVRVSFMEKRAAATLSFVSYDGLPEMDSSIEFDIMWRF